MTLSATINNPKKVDTQHDSVPVDRSNRYAVERLALDKVPQIVELTRQRIGECTASAETMLRILTRNENSFWGVFGQDSDRSLVGYYSFLFLNEDGHRALLARDLDTVNPPLSSIAATAKPASAIYLWGVIAKGGVGATAPLVIRRLSLRYAGLPLYTTMATADGMRRGRSFGFKPISPAEDRIGGLFAFGGYMQLPKSKGTTAVRVVSSANEFQHAQTIRAAVFMSEQLCPFLEEYDGNDYSAQHIVGYVDEEPAATIRIRYFAQFAKLERYAVLKRFRHSPVKDEIIQLAISIARKKGYLRLYGQAQARLRSFWEARGFSVSNRNIEIRYSDHDYIEVEKILSPHPEPISLACGPMILNRLEGSWDKEGVLEASSHRPATRPC